MVYLSLLPATMAELVDFSKAVGLYACKWEKQFMISTFAFVNFGTFQCNIQQVVQIQWGGVDNKM